VKVRLEDIPPEGRDVQVHTESFSPEELGPQVERLRGPLWARLHLERQGDMVRATGTYGAELNLTCSRCLASFEHRAEGPVEMVFLPRSQEGRDEVLLSDDELEVSFYNEGEIDLDQLLKDELSLALPMAPLCRPDCPGICPHCGRDLASGSCECRQNNIDPRWAKLAQLKKQ
jgi:uncharacterized protein